MTKRLQDYKETLRIKAKFTDALSSLQGHPGFTCSMAWEVMPQVRSKKNAYAILIELLDEMACEQVVEKSGDHYRVNAE